MPATSALATAAMAGSGAGFAADGVLSCGMADKGSDIGVGKAVGRSLGAKPGDKIVLGIDPGTTVMGYGVVLKQGTKLSILRFGVLHLSKYKDHHLKLRKIYERITELIKEFQPQEMAIEAPFYGENVQSMLKLGRAQGVAIAAAMAADLEVTEYAPAKIKVSITGNGLASKGQVAAMLTHLLDLDSQSVELHDETDAIAVAVCHLNQGVLGKQSAKSWGDFVKANPNRVK